MLELFDIKYLIPAEDGLFELITLARGNSLRNGLHDDIEHIISPRDVNELQKEHPMMVIINEEEVYI